MKLEIETCILHINLVRCSMRQKWKTLVKEDRPFLKRLLPALLLAFALSFSFIVIGIFDLYLSNIGNYPFAFSTILWPVIGLGVACLAIITLVFIILRGKFYDLAISLGIGVLLAGYLQGNFLNINLGELTGDTIPWHYYSKEAVLNSLLWMAIILLPFILYYFSRKVWRAACVVLPIILIGMQVAGIASVAMSTDIAGKEQEIQSRMQEAYLSDEGMFEVSSKNNVIVFVLDRLDQKYIDKVNRLHPGFFDKFDGFTMFPDHMSLYCRTYPSVTYLLTGEISYFDKPAETFFTEAYQKGKFIPTLRENNYTTKMYMDAYAAYNNVSNLNGLADNIRSAQGDVQIRLPSIMKKMVQFSAYRYAPHIAKPSFWFSEGEFANTVVFDEDTQYYDKSNDAWVMQSLQAKGLTVQDQQNNFSYIHWIGCHQPSLNENGDYVGEENTDITRHTMGEFNLVYEYLQQMKALGVYDNATIIITGDHGKSEDSQTLGTYKTTGLFVKPAGSKDTPLQISNKPVSHANFEATVLEGAGISKDGFGQSVWDVPENDSTPRRFLYKVDDEPYRLEEYAVTGDANDFSNWKWIRNIPIQYDH